MHAYLISGGNKESRSAEALALAKKLGIETLNFEVLKIEDARNLNKHLSLTPTKSGVIIEGLEKATIEAKNAILKNLEEKDKFTFILLAQNKANLIPTIVDRCSVINLKTTISVSSEESAAFYEMTTEEKLIHLASIKDRLVASEFITALLVWGESMLISVENPKKLADFLSKALNAQKRLSANTNVYLQLTSFAVSLDA